MESKWQEMYKRKLMSAEDAVKVIANGDLIASASINGQPTQIVDALVRRMASGAIKDARFLFSLSVRMSSLHNPEIIEQCYQPWIRCMPVRWNAISSIRGVIPMSPIVSRTAL
ncbi:MAG TPA: hypothetical protein PLC88_01440 [Syntrophomonas sp.]|nr:hypothetical protein [Syntrophomonas sp.]